MFEARDILIYLALICHGNANLMYDMVEKRDDLDEKDMEEKLSHRNFKCITILDKGFPEQLKRIYPTPLVLFYEGDISLLYNIKENISVVGSRDNTAYGAIITNEIVTKLSNKFNIVSGMARGIDAIAHWSALKNGKKTIAVLGCGTNICFPTCNLKLFNLIKKKGLVVSEYPPDTEPNQLFFPMRNRIIAGLGDSLLVTEAQVKSGTAITVNCALEQGKEVFCVPHQVGSFGAGCNALIHDGAFLIQSAEDILDYYGNIK